MTNEELADLIVARTANLREHMDRRFGEQDAKLATMDDKLATMDDKLAAMDGKLAAMDGKLAGLDTKVDAQDQRFIDQMMILEQHMREHFDLKLSTVQTHIYGKLLSIESDMLDLRGDVAKLRETVNAHARMLEERR